MKSSFVSQKESVESVDSLAILHRIHFNVTFKVDQRESIEIILIDQHVLSILFINDDKDEIMLIFVILDSDRITLIVVFINALKNQLNERCSALEISSII